MRALGSAQLFITTRIRCVFTSETNKPRMTFGTAFWIATADIGPVLITNKHNIDPSMTLDPQLGYTLAELSINVREEGLSESSRLIFQPSTEFLPVREPSACIVSSDDADCAILVNLLNRMDPSAARRVVGTPERSLAPEAHFREEMSLADPVTFIGFAGTQEESWFDEAWNLPIARVATLASPPSKPFQNKGIRSADVLLVSGLSFSGSSGSPVYTHPMTNLRGNRIPPFLVGIMSGHWTDGQGQTYPAHHSGLSYFTRSTSIRAVLERVRAKKL
jgi:hypothetical protein